jgi:hypothetical protein
MSPDTSFDFGVTRSTGATVDRLATEASESLATFRSGLSAAGACWGGDHYGAAFGAVYLPSAQDAAVGAVEHANQLAQAGAHLFETAAAQENTEQNATDAAKEI